jgi:hypothetical protein
MPENDWKAMRVLRVKPSLLIRTCFACLYAVVPRPRPQPQPPWRSVGSTPEQPEDDDPTTNIHIRYTRIDPRHGLAVSSCTTTGTSDASGHRADKRHTIDAGVDSALARLYTTANGSRELVDNARGVLVFPSVVAAGFWVGGQYGEGSLRVGGSTAGYYSTATGSIGWQIGCSPSDYRRIRRWEHEHVLEAVQRRLDRKPDAMTIRRSTVEHVFGTLKHWMGATHFLTRTLGRVSTEMSLQVLAYNLKRVMNILGVAGTIKAMRMAKI